MMNLLFTLNQKILKKKLLMNIAHYKISLISNFLVSIRIIKIRKKKGNYIKELLLKVKL